MDELKFIITYAWDGAILIGIFDTEREGMKWLFDNYYGTDFDKLISIQWASSKLFT